jgi:hypothetical protein
VLTSDNEEVGIKIKRDWLNVNGVKKSIIRLSSSKDNNSVSTLKRIRSFFKTPFKFVCTVCERLEVG